MGYAVGDEVRGTVTAVVDYGAFVLLEDGSTGLVHISKLSDSFVKDIHSFIKKGDAVTAYVIGYNGNKTALSLTGGKKKRSDFETMLSSFRSESDEKLADIMKSSRYDRNGKRRRNK